MKNIFMLIFFLFSTICKSQTENRNFESNSNLLQRVWMLIEFKNFKKEDLIKNHAQINLTDFKNPNAFVGCNQIGFKIKVKKNKLLINDLVATEIYCGDKMELEKTFSKSLLANFNYKIKGHTLTLINSKKEKMVFVAQDWD